MTIELPVDASVPRVRDALRSHRAAVLVAAPGAGKTTRVPPALVDDGPAILLQPRRVAARAIARRIAGEQGWTVGREVGWHVRGERQFARDTKLLVATEGILTARLQHDPLLSEFATVILDEFHERSIHADLGIALAKQAWLAREDLRILVMSATMDAEQASAFLGGCPIVQVPGRLHPLDIAYRPGWTVVQAARELYDTTDGQILCFEPGAGEVRRTAGELRLAFSAADVVELHGSLPADEQDRALQPARTRRIIVATNIAETSLTVPGVRAVIDTGQQKVARYDAKRGVDSLSLERVSEDSADQRAGRAARLGPGVVRRLWGESDRLRPHREPDILRMDLAGPVLTILSWGGEPAGFEWYEAPPRAVVDDALELLERLGAVGKGGLTARGAGMSRLPVHPRLARILLEADGAYEAALACALLSERQLLPRHPPTTACDLLASIDAPGTLPARIRQTAAELQRLAGGRGERCGERELRRALFAGYADRVARRRGPGDPRVLLCSGHGARLGDESGVRDGEYLVALDVVSSGSGAGSEARIRVASVVDPEWLEPDASAVVHEVHAPTGSVRAFEERRYGRIVLSKRDVPPDPEAAARLLAEAWLARPLPAADEQLLNRLRFAGIERPLEDLVAQAAAGRRALSEIRLEEALDWTAKRALEERAPARFVAPSGRPHALDYRADGTVALEIKLQEMFGLAETPRIGTRREPLLVLLLAPNGRPVQTTRDLRSFWTTTYPEVRKELRARYPKHPWPEDPWSAAPTARTKRASGAA